MSDQSFAALLDDDTRPEPAGALSASATFAWRGLLKIRHVPEQLLDATIGPVLLLVSFTYLFGGAIEGSTGDYLQFVLPGLLVMAVMLTTTYSGVALYADKSRGVVDRFRSLPVWGAAPLVGAVAGDAVRSIMAATSILVAGAIMGFDAAAGIPGVIAGALLVVLFAFALSWVFTALALVARSESTVQGTAMTGIFVLVFFSSVFVSPDTLPDALRAIVDVNPISHLTSAVRHLFAGTAEAGGILLVLGEAAALTAIFGTLTWRGLQRS